MKSAYLFPLAFLMLVSAASAQVISVDDSQSAQSLIENNLVQGCVEVSNITSSVNGTVNGFASFGYFERASSNFPFQNGIVLSTGNVNSAGNATNINILNEGELTWGTDPDLETALGISDTHNATSIEFDFVSISNIVQFNYILASEEYFANFPCDYSDGFAFLIKEAGTADPYTNIALIPGTNTPVNTTTIHDEIVGFCPAENNQYFEGYNLGDTNYNGRTSILTATASITPNVTYHIKLVIADQDDENYDSAVFIQGNSFNPTVDLGPDVSTCGTNYTINADIQNPLASYAWYQDGALLNSETNSSLNASSSGNYRVEITIPLGTTICVIEDDINITLNSEQAIGQISDYELCDDPSEDGIETFNLTTKNNEILNAVSPGNYTISYHLTNDDAQNNANAILLPIQNTANPQPIFVRVEDIDNGCMAYTSFNLVVNPLPDIVTPTPLTVCDDAIVDGSTQIDLTSANNEITQGDGTLQVSYHFTQNEADNGLNPIPSPYVNTLPNEQLFVRVVNPNTGCFTTTTIDIIVLSPPSVNDDLTPPDACDSDGDGFAFFDLTALIPDLLQGLTGVTVTFHTSNQDAIDGINSIGDPSNFQNTVANVQILFIRIEDDVTGCATIVPITIFTNMLESESDIRDYETCDDQSADGIEDFDLAAIATQISNNLANVTVTFYETQDDMDNDINPIDQTVPYTVNTSHRLFLKIENFNCDYRSEINLIVNPPIILQAISPIDYCDTDDDGFTEIDLQSFNDDVSNSLTGVVVTYHTSQVNADTGSGVLPQYYTNTSNPQTLFARVTDPLTGCYSTIDFEINVIPAPTVTSPIDIIICDDDQDAYSVVNLEDQIPNFISSTANVNISFHTSLTDQQNNDNPITNPDAFNATNQTIYVRVESTITGCFATVEIPIIVNTLPVFQPISNFQGCETDGDERTDFLFNTKDSEILNGQAGKQVLYFETENDAINRTNAIDKNNDYTNTSNPQTIYVRVENITDQDCYGVSSFTIEVGAIPLYNPPTNFLVCDDISNDGVETFDLSTKIDEMSNGIADTLIITFYANFDDAENSQNPIDTDFTNTSNPQQIYARIENGSYCHAIAGFGLNVIQAPIVNTPSPMTVCDDDQDGRALFDLTISEFEIVDVRNNDIEITYFESMDALELNSNQIADPENYQNTENPQTVYAKVSNTISGCYVAIPLSLNVNLPPALNNVPTIEICDNDADTFEFSEATQLLLDDATGLNISYHLNLADAQANQNPLSNSYTYTGANQTIYVRVQNVSSTCVTIDSFNLVVHPNPIANNVPDLTNCDNDYDFMYLFNLTQQNSTVLGTQDPNLFSVTYHETSEDATNGEFAISNDTNYNAADGQELFIRVENDATGCFSTTSFFTRVHRKPVVDIPQQTICLDNFPLTVIAGEIVAGDSYLWSTGATTSEIDITQIGQYWVTVTTLNGCSTTTTFDVIESEQATIEVTETVDFSDPNNVTVTISGIGNYMYVLDDGEPQESNVFENVSLGYHTITIIDLNGCASISKEIVVIDTPKFMTPNGDGYFDTWHISGVENLPGTTISIFDRYGKQMTFLTSTSNGWDGTYNGKIMPATDYWYVANVKKDGLEFQVKGHFALRR